MVRVTCRFAWKISRFLANLLFKEFGIVEILAWGGWFWLNTVPQIPLLMLHKTTYDATSCGCVPGYTKRLLLHENQGDMLTGNTVLTF